MAASPACRIAEKTFRTGSPLLLAPIMANRDDAGEPKTEQPGSADRGPS